MLYSIIFFMGKSTLRATAVVTDKREKNFGVRFGSVRFGSSLRIDYKLSISSHMRSLDVSILSIAVLIASISFITPVYQ